MLHVFTKLLINKHKQLLYINFECDYSYTKCFAVLSQHITFVMHHVISLLYVIQCGTFQKLAM